MAAAWLQRRPRTTPHDPRRLRRGREPQPGPRDVHARAGVLYNTTTLSAPVCKNTWHTLVVTLRRRNRIRSGAGLRFLRLALRLRWQVRRGRRSSDAIAQVTYSIYNGRTA